MSLSAIKGSGPGGKITKEDVEKYSPAGAGGAPAAAGATTGAPIYEVSLHCLGGNSQGPDRRIRVAWEYHMGGFLSVYTSHISSLPG